MPSARVRFGLRRRVVVLALLAFALQAAIPTGFMIGVEGGQARLMLCPVAAPVLQASGSAMTPRHHHHAGMDAGSMALMHHGSAAAAAGASCPFALAGAAPLLAQWPALAEPWFITLRPAAPAAIDSLPAEPPARHLAARGPPALA